MYQRHDLPQTFNNYFNYVSEILVRSSRKLEKNFICFCTKQTDLKNQIFGVKIWNDIRLIIRNLTFKKFITEYKLHLLLSQQTFNYHAKS